MADVENQVRTNRLLAVAADRWRRDRGKQIEKMIYQRARQRVAQNKTSSSYDPTRAPTPFSSSSMTCKEYLGYLLVIVFLGTSLVYTYLAYILREIRPVHTAMGGLSAHKIAGLPPPPPPPAPTRDPLAEERRLAEIEAHYVIDSQLTVPSKMLIDITKAEPCPVANKDEKPSVRVRRPSHVCTGQRRLMEGDKRLLTLVTTNFDVVYDQTPHTTANMLQLWPRLGARIRPVLFLYDPEDEAAMAEKACSLGWDVLVAPVCDDDGAPYIADMIKIAQQMWESKFYGYAHRNTLFDQTLVRTLKFLDTEIDDFPMNLIVGMRTNLKLLNFAPSLKSLEQLGEQARARGTLGWLLNVDYFIMAKTGYKVPTQMVAGAKNLGNWAVWDALLQKTAVIDIGNTTTAVHQMSWTVPRRIVFSEPDLPEGFEQTYGIVWCAPLKVRQVNAKTMVLMKRVQYRLCGPGQWSRLPINHPKIPRDREEPFVRGGSIMFQRME